LNSKFFTILIIVGSGSESTKIENMVEVMTFGPKREKVKTDWRKLHNEDLPNFTVHWMLFVTEQRRVRWVGMLHILGGRTEMYTWFW
jgi:hypothetical protein